MNKHNYARIILLARDELEIKIEENQMHEDISAIWISVNLCRKQKNENWGHLQEHRLLFKPEPNLTKTDRAQFLRWNNILEGWKTAAQDPLCTVIGDLNLDFLNWSDPEPGHANMINRTKDEIETRGFAQIIRGHTRTWRHQKDSLIDHCWLAKPDRIICWEKHP